MMKISTMGTDNKTEIKNAISDWANKILAGIAVFFLVNIYNDVKDTQRIVIENTYANKAQDTMIGAHESRLKALEDWRQLQQGEILKYYQNGINAKKDK